MPKISLKYYLVAVLLIGLPLAALYSDLQNVRAACIITSSILFLLLILHIKVLFTDMDKSLKLAIANMQKRTEKLPVLAAPTFLGASRMLSQSELQELKLFANKELSLDFSDDVIKSLGQKLYVTELNCVGRMPGQLVDAVVRTLCSISFAANGKKNFSYLEIGVLFGVSSVGMYQIARAYYEQMNFSLVDPFEGYYDQVLDYGTHIPVREKHLFWNIQLNALPEKDFNVYKGLSSDTSIHTAIADESIDFAFIDGDHSYDGLKLDIELYLPKVRAGGLVIIDNYNELSRWPDVTKYVDGEFAKDARCSLLAKVGSSAVFRKV